MSARRVADPSIGLLGRASRIALFGVTFAWALALCQASDQFGGPQASANTVWIHATVTDAKGQLVTTLRQEDFIVVSNGKPQALSVFSTEQVPVSVALMLDMSGSMAGVVPNISRATEALVTQFKRGDRINIGTFKSDVLVSSRFTSNRDSILHGVDRMIVGADIPCAPPSKTLTSGPVPTRRGGSAIWDGVECSIWALDRDAEAFRRVALLVTDGDDNASYGNVVTATNFANRTGVIIYAIGLSRGMTATDLSHLASATGGSYFSLDRRADFTEAFRQVGEEIHAQYILGFEPAQPGSVGSLKVTTRNPGLTVRARHGYAPK